MDMEQFRILCTPKQTKKALELGAPIIKVDTTDKRMIYYGRLCYPRTEADYPYAIPTAEEMIGWLRSEGFRFKIEELSDTVVAYRATFGYWYGIGNSNDPKVATIAVISEALKYLGKIRRKKEMKTSAILRIIDNTRANDVEGVLRYVKKLIPEEEYEIAEKLIRGHFNPNASVIVMDDKK